MYGGKKMIPKIIHYCWFGKNKKSTLIKKCIDSWYTFLPDFKIIEWNEDNFDVYQNEYIKKAYEEKKWAFVSDYARMKVLYEHGGIYFDTDAELIKRIPDSFLELNAFSGVEEFSCLVNPGLIYACHPKDKLVEQLLKSYENDQFSVTKLENMITINIRLYKILEKYGYVKQNIKQTIEGLTIFPSDFFCGYDGQKRKIKISENTISVHHYAASWLPWYRKVRLKLGTIARRIKYR